MHTLKSVIVYVCAWVRCAYLDLSRGEGGTVVGHALGPTHVGRQDAQPCPCQPHQPFINPSFAHLKAPCPSFSFYAFGVGPRSPQGSESKSPRMGILSSALSFLRKRRVATSGWPLPVMTMHGNLGGHNHAAGLNEIG